MQRTESSDKLNMKLLNTSEFHKLSIENGFSKLKNVYTWVLIISNMYAPEDMDDTLIGLSQVYIQ